MHARRSPPIFPILLLFFSLGPATTADRAPADRAPADRETVAIASWLVSGPVDLALPAFGDESDFEVAELLEGGLAEVAELWPAAGESGPRGGTWTEQATPSLELTAGGGARAAWAAVYLETDRFLTASLELRSQHLLLVFLDGEEMAKKSKADATEPEVELETRKRRGRWLPEPPAPGALRAELPLATGKHLLLVEAVRDPGGPDSWTLAGELSLADASRLSAGTSPRHRLRLADLLDVDAVTAVDISPDGRFVAAELRHPSVPAEDEETWIELRRTGDGSLVRTIRDAESFTWADAAGDDTAGDDAAGDHFAWVTAGEEGSTLWWSSFSTGEQRPLLEDVQGLDRYFLTADSVIYSRRQEATEDEREVKRYRGPTDRWSNWRRTMHLYQAPLARNGGVPRKLTAGRISDELQDVSSDGRRVLFARTYYDRTERPFSATEIFELDLATLTPRAIAEVGWFDDASYSPDGRRILVRGGPSLFDDAGRNLAEGRHVNDYDSQLFVVDVETGEADAITRDFPPTVLDATWSRHDGRIYFRAQDRNLNRLVRYDPESRVHLPIATGLDSVSAISVARGADALACFGTSAHEPQRVFVGSGEGGFRHLAFPEEERFGRIDLGRVEPWIFTTEGGEEILGRAYYPPGYDPGAEGEYPLIVYYYGGTSPIPRDFGGRYPKNLWAANGYVVYVLNPSGATGFGQEFSSRHANDWGKRAGREILAGIEKFLRAHPAVDRQRIGCMGGSYGGFMTMYLLTRSELFAAAISHAGISNIASYWGAGWWGYLYSAVASADSYPWNNPELYAEQSPLFAADEITEPLLLFHGGNDINVPPGESQQMYTALEVLGREVELIEFAGEGHRIFDYPKRKLWSETILAWFDKHLKGEPEYWQHLWGTDDKPRG